MATYDTRLPHNQQQRNRKPNPHLPGVTLTWGNTRILIEAERNPLSNALSTSAPNGPNRVCIGCYFMTANHCPRFAVRGARYDCKLHKIIFTKIEE
jgi:hypothetical protein